MAFVEKRGNGYRITVYDGYSVAGKQVKRHKTWTPAPGMTEAQIKRELEKQKVFFEEECKSGRGINRSIKFQDFAEKWFTEYGNTHLRATTRASYRGLSKRVYEAIGHLRLDRITPGTLNKFYLQLSGLAPNRTRSVVAKIDIRGFLESQGVSISGAAERTDLSVSTIKAILSGKGVALKSARKLTAAFGVPLETWFAPSKANEIALSAKTIHHYHAFISSVLERAVRWNYIPENPCRRVDPPKLERKMIRCLNKEEAKRFLQLLQKEDAEKQAIFYTFLFCGLRRGELLGIEWSDLDFRAKTLTIQRSSLYTKEDGVFTDTTKTESSKRTIVMSDELVLVLLRHKAAQEKLRKQVGEDWVESNRVFSEWNGAPMSPNRPYNMLRRLLEKNGLPAVSLHSLRHTNATLMIQSGTDIRTTSERLGHSKTSTTMDIYVHQIKSANEHAAANLSAALAFEEGA